MKRLLRIFSFRCFFSTFFSLSSLLLSIRPLLSSKINCPQLVEPAANNRYWSADQTVSDQLFQKTGEHCYDFDRNLSELVGYADIIFSGTVESLSPVENQIFDVKSVGEQSIYFGVVSVRRIFKDNFVRPDNGEKKFGTLLNVNNFFDWHICDSKVDIGDTRIFLLTIDGHLPTENENDRWNLNNQNYRLNSSLLKINLKNLDAVESAVKGPCEKMLCMYGARCYVNALTGQAYCSCVFSCSNFTQSPVCGSNNKTYGNDCLLKLESCVQKAYIRVAFSSSCEKRHQNPCESLDCRHGSNCVISVDGKSAKCVCPEKCYHYGDSRGSRPLCGEDGRDYPTLCHIRKESCKQKKHIRVKYVGLCDPCAHVDCPRGTLCKLSQQREPMCRCSEQCQLNYKPVCASNGNSYPNVCVMQVQACKQSADWRVFADGLCDNVDNPCRLLKCEFGEQCVIDKSGQAACHCLNNCLPVIRPVCGKDGLSYENECQLNLHACTRKQRNSVSHHGSCGIVGPCSNYECANGAICVVQNSRPFCQCPQCSEDLDPLCASTGVSYANQCKLSRQACLSKKPIFVKYRGFCRKKHEVFANYGCQSKICDFYGICVSDDRGKGECQCLPENCDTTEGPLCGTDGLSYENECELKLASCQKQVFIMVSSRAKCDSCLSVRCEWGARCQDGQCVCPTRCPHVDGAIVKPICGSDGLLYKSRCFMLKAACLKSMTVKVVGDELCPQEPLSSPAASEAVSCDCDRFGSISPMCDSSGQCTCRIGVGGKRCNHCLSGFWGLHLIPQGAAGCTPCGCSAFGASRDDCQQTVGRCMCRPGAQGAKCDSCASRHHLMTPSGCATPDSFADYYAGGCRRVRCFFGAMCRETTAEVDPSPTVPPVTLASCSCPSVTDDGCAFLSGSAFGVAVKNVEVCGSDGKTYETGCHLNKIACEHQKDLVVASIGRCNGQSEDFMLMDRPLLNTNKTAQNGDFFSNFAKSTPKFFPDSWISLNSSKKIFLDKNGLFKITVGLNLMSENGSILLYQKPGFSLTFSVILGRLQIRAFKNGHKLKLRTFDRLALNREYLVEIIVGENSANLSIDHGAAKSAIFKRYRRNFDGKTKIFKNKIRRAAVLLGNLKYRKTSAIFGVDSKIRQNAAGFHGCIVGLKIGRKSYRFTSTPDGDILKSFKIGQCEKNCLNGSC